jgi:pyridinium-3,5-bisthiocarboxylic acid mononucleotide nickel chelatase
VTLHEVGALDALVDIVGCVEGLERLDVSAVYSRPVALGRGWVRASHGTMAVPAPATAILIEGVEVGPDGPVAGEATTPTGALLLRVLSEGRPPARWRGVASGWGAGGRDPREYPNALRVMIAEPAAEAGEVVVTTADLDDLSPEYVEPLREALFAAGALDVQVWTTQAKKGRPGFRVEVLSDAAAETGVIDAFFRHSSTAGVRRWTAERVTLHRRQIEVETREGVSVRVKVVESPGGTRVKPEFDDVANAARRVGRPALEVAREVQQRAEDQVTREAGRPLTANKES